MLCYGTALCAARVLAAGGGGGGETVFYEGGAGYEGDVVEVYDLFFWSVHWDWSQGYVEREERTRRVRSNFGCATY